MAFPRPSFNPKILFKLQSYQISSISDESIEIHLKNPIISIQQKRYFEWVISSYTANKY